MTAETDDSVPVRVQLPYHLRNLAGVDGEVVVEVGRSVTPSGRKAGHADAADAPREAGGTGGQRAEGPTVADLLDALEARFPALEGTIRDHDRGARRAYLRFFTCGEDVSHEGEGYRLPSAVIEGREVFRVVGAISGG
ncbi:MAG: MoaD/ThiS family protein [Gemmatimonadota bacterium]